MTLREFIKKHRYNSDHLIVMHNKDDKWFYGDFVNSMGLEEYLDYNIIEKEKTDSKYVILVQLPDYEYPLGLGSMREKWKREIEINKKS